MHWYVYADPQWWAQWGEITSCSPDRTIAPGEIIDDDYFSITGAVVRVKVPLEDLMLAFDPEDEVLKWHAATRLLAFVHPTYPNTITVDTAPNRLVPNPSPPPPYTSDGGEGPAIFVPR